MGCFSTCFGKSKHHRPPRRRRPVTASPSLLHHLQKYESVDDFQVGFLIEEEKSENPTDPLPESSEEKREKINLSGRKKVSFNLNVKVYEELPIEDVVVEEEEEEEEEEEKGISGNIKEARGKEEKKACEIQSPSESSSSSLFSYPPNHRYQNCLDSDGEFDELMSSEESDIDDDDDDDDYVSDDNNEVESDIKPVIGTQTQDQSSESLFSLELESRKQKWEDKEVNSPTMVNKNYPCVDDSNRSNRNERSRYVDSVLNPVENVSQWKVIKAKSKQASKDQAKENLNLEQDFSSGVGKERFEKEIGVDTSLSSWLVGSGAVTTTPNSRSSSVSVGNSASDTSKISISPNKFEDRPILGALTVDEIRQFSASPSPRKSPNQSPDEMPIIGSVGSYWSHTGQTTGSGSSTKSRSRFAESTKVMWDPTPFETRLEKALEQEGIVEQQVLRS